MENIFNSRFIRICARRYIIPKENHMPKEITVLTKEYGSFDKATTKMYIADDLETPAEKIY